MPRRLRFRITVSLGVGFILWRSGLLLAGVPDIRIYFATDTNAFAPLLGCALAIGYRENRIPAPSAHQAVLSPAALLIAASLPLHYTDRRLPWATVPVALLSVIALHAALSSPLRWLENPILRWFGMISYGLYLWHFMLISLPWERWPILPLLGMIATPIAAAWLSWRLVEAPLLGATVGLRDHLKPFFMTKELRTPAEEVTSSPDTVRRDGPFEVKPQAE